MDISRCHLAIRLKSGGKRFIEWLKRVHRYIQHRPTGRTPLHRETLWSVPPPWLFFKLRPRVYSPMLNDYLVTLARFLDGFLPAPSDSFQDASHVAWRVSYSILMLDHLGYTPMGPYIPSETKMLRPFGQQFRQSYPLLFTQPGFWPASSSMAQSFYPASLARFTHWLTAPAVSPSASAISFCFQPFSFSRQACDRRSSRQSFGCPMLFFPMEASISLFASFFRKSRQCQ